MTMTGAMIGLTSWDCKMARLAAYDRNGNLQEGGSMCSAPDVPEAVQRQDARMPERSARGNGAEDPLRRRQGYSALLRAAAGAVYQDKGIILHFDQDFYLFWNIIPDLA